MQKLTCALLVDDDQTTNYLNKLLLNRLAVTDKILVASMARKRWTCWWCIVSKLPPIARP